MAFLPLKWFSSLFTETTVFFHAVWTQWHQTVADGLSPFKWDERRITRLNAPVILSEDNSLLKKKKLPTHLLAHLIYQQFCPNDFTKGMQAFMTKDFNVLCISCVTNLSGIFHLSNMTSIIDLCQSGCWTHLLLVSDVVRCCSCSQLINWLQFQNLTRLYLDKATLVWNGNAVSGQDALGEFFESLPSSEFQVHTLDCQPVHG